MASELKHVWQEVESRLNHLDQKRLGEQIKNSQSVLAELVDKFKTVAEAASLDWKVTDFNVQKMEHVWRNLHAMPADTPKYLESEVAINHHQSLENLCSLVQETRSCEQELEKKVNASAFEKDWKATLVTISREGTSIWRWFKGSYRTALRKFKNTLKISLPRKLEERIELLEKLVHIEEQYHRIAAKENLGNAHFGVTWQKAKTDYIATIKVLEWVNSQIEVLGGMELVQKQVQGLDRSLDYALLAKRLRDNLEAWRRHWTTIVDLTGLDFRKTFDLEDISQLDLERVIKLLQAWPPQSQYLPNKPRGGPREEPSSLDPAKDRYHQDDSKTDRRPTDKGGQRVPKNSVSNISKQRVQPPQPTLMCRLTHDKKCELFFFGDELSGINRIMQNDSSLSKRNGYYPIGNLTSSVIVERFETEKRKIPLFEDGAVLCFKFRKHWKGTGRNVKGLTGGHFLVITPREWNRQGDIEIEPIPSTDQRFVAHFFHRSNDGVDDAKFGFEEYPHHLLFSTGIKLTGHRIIDDSDNGNLFGREPPSIDDNSEIFWIRVGDEGEGGDWKGENFRPKKSLAEVLNGREGHFYVRIYNEQGCLLDSTEFRYCADLDAIFVNGEAYSRELIAPAVTGHFSTTVRFIDVNGQNIQSNLRFTSNQISMLEDGTVTVPTQHDTDTLTGYFDVGSREIDVVVKLPRIRWRLLSAEEDAEQSPPWCDKAIELNTEKFHQLAKKKVSVEINLPPRIRSFCVGFGSNISRSYLRNKFELLDFIDYSEVDERQSADQFFRIRCSDTEVCVIRIVNENEIVEVAYPCVQGGHKLLRQGKGFSRKELKTAGLAISEATQLQLRVDRRRKTEYTSNVQKIKEAQSSA